MIQWNFFFDVLKFSYGRMVLFNVSSYLVFFGIMWKDICYALWHFMLKFDRWVIALIVKIFNKNGGNSFADANLSPTYKYMIKTIESTVYLMGVPRMLVRQWEPLCDFTHLEVDQSMLDDEEDMLQVSNFMQGKQSPPEIGKRTSMAEALGASMGGKLVKAPDPTGLGLRLTFANVSVCIHNLPAELKQDMQDLSNVKMSGSGRVMLFLHDTEGLAWKL